ncbi:MAG: GxxExxY protein [Flaviaesturariibacter sp.]|nr:GxxExxY protein [Flaviaesturariibacter sp.]
MPELLLKEESYKLIGFCMEVHRQLGMGFKEVVYKDALEIEFRNNSVSFSREKEFKIEYKGIVLSHKYFADFIVFEQIVLEVKAASAIAETFAVQTVNYLKASGLRLGIIANFGEKSFTSKRVIF